MPRYAYTVRDPSGNTIKNIMDAHSQKAVVDKLHAKNLFIVSVREMSAARSSVKKRKSKAEGKKFKRKKVKLQDLVSFSRQLATMLEAGVTLIRSLEVIYPQVESQKLSNILFEVKSDVEQGLTLHSAIAKHPAIFNQFWVSLLEVGESSGTLPTVLNKLNFYLEQQAKFKSTIISGIIYPAILFCVAMGAIAFFALFVGPKFEEIFINMNAELPVITKVMLNSFKFIKTKFLWIIGSFLLAGYLFRKYIKTYQGRLRFEQFLFNLPQAGDVIRNIIVERFASQMAILLDAGVPILYALDISERLVDNNTCALVIADIKEAVKGGDLLVRPMEKSGFFPAMCTQMINVGEETGELSKMLKHVARYYQDQVETFMQRFATIVEPFMLVFMGGIIGVIVVSMFLPMFNLAQM